MGLGKQFALLMAMTVGAPFGAALADVGGSSSPTPMRQSGPLEDVPDRAPNQGFEVEVEITRCPFATKEALSVPFSLTRVVLEGSSILPVDRVDRITQRAREASTRAVGQETLAVLCDVRDGLLDAYRSEGYPIVRVELEPQKVEGGVVRFRAFEPELAAVKIVDLGTDEDPTILAKGFARFEQQLEKRSAGRAMLWSDVERAVALVRDTPGLDASIALRPSAIDLGADNPRTPLELEITPLESRTVQGFVGVQHLGAEVFGRLAGIAGVSYADVGTWGVSEWRGTLYSTLPIENSARGKQYLGQISYDWRELATGVNFGLSLTAARSEPGGELAILEMRGESYLGRAFFSYPLILSSGFRLIAEVSMEALEQENFVFTDQTISSDSLRAAGAKLDASWKGGAASAPWSASADVSYRRGLPGLGSSQSQDTDLSRIGAKIDYWKLQADVEAQGRLWRQGPGASLRVAGQWTDYALPASEEYLVGNFSIGRGYDPGSVTGDRGFAAAFEIMGPEWSNAAGNGASVDPYVFYDYVELEQLDEAALEREISVASAGLGARLRISSKTSLDISYAKPLETPGISQTRPSPLLLFNLTRLF